MLTALELLKIAREEKPHIHYTMNYRQDAIAGRHTDADHWVIVASQVSDSVDPNAPPRRWVTMTHGLWIDGHPCTSDWMPESECPT